MVSEKRLSTKVMTNIKKRSGYTLFLSETAKNEQKCVTEIAKQWKLFNENEKNRWNQKAHNWNKENELRFEPLRKGKQLEKSVPRKVNFLSEQPDEIFLLIFSFLDSISLLRLGICEKKFFRLTLDEKIWAKRL